MAGLARSILLFVGAFSTAMGPVSDRELEIFPTKLRGRAMAVSIFLLWFACFLVSQTFLCARGFRAVDNLLICRLQPGELRLRHDDDSRNKGSHPEEIEASWKQQTL
jgi:hypothetical protein